VNKYTFQPAFRVDLVYVIQRTTIACICLRHRYGANGPTDGQAGRVVGAVAAGEGIGEQEQEERIKKRAARHIGGSDLTPFRECPQHAATRTTSHLSPNPQLTLSIPDRRHSTLRATTLLSQRLRNDAAHSTTGRRCIR